MQQIDNFKLSESECFSPLIKLKQYEMIYHNCNVVENGVMHLKMLMLLKKIMSNKF